MSFIWCGLFSSIWLIWVSVVLSWCSRGLLWSGVVDMWLGSFLVVYWSVMYV